VKPVQFAYYRPASRDEALALVQRYGADGRVLAGGQSLVPALNMRLATPAALIDINRLPGLDGISLEPEGFVVGALARHEAVEASPLVARHAPLIAQAMPHVGHRAIRTRGTVGGSVALADPAAELPACLVALETPTAYAEGGFKGAGEAGTAGAPGAVLNAVNDALAPFGARVTSQPITPEVVLKALGQLGSGLEIQHQASAGDGSLRRSSGKCRNARPDP